MFIAAPNSKTSAFDSAVEAEDEGAAIAVDAAGRPVVVVVVSLPVVGGFVLLAPAAAATEA